MYSLTAMHIRPCADVQTSDELTCQEHAMQQGGYIMKGDKGGHIGWEVGRII